ALAVRAQRTDLAARGLTHPRARLAAQHSRLLAQGGRASLAWSRDAGIRSAALRAFAARLRRELRAPPREAAIVEGLGNRLQHAHERLLAQRQSRIDTLAQNLAHLSPQRVLERGYAIVTRGGAQGEVVQSARTLSQGDAIALQFAAGRATATVRNIDD
ncbi:MAG: exodeoxyribonuclease VII large subunit, partial [Casimicrobiaceae bacterium]